MLGILAASLYIMHSLVYNVSLLVFIMRPISLYIMHSLVYHVSLLIFIMHSIYCHVTWYESEREARNKRCPNCSDLSQQLNSLQH